MHRVLSVVEREKDLLGALCLYSGGMEGAFAVRALRTAERVLCWGMARSIGCTTLVVVIVLGIPDVIDGEEMSDVAPPALKTADRSSGTRIPLFPQQPKKVNYDGRLVGLVPKGVAGASRAARNER